ncbi:hypothetical protein GJ698_02290 [Pseudoduganella sp. FT26W]|uniref:Uncharacterized protein n=1 Tax=Duganella aquatilis TaxID=2666082 RepID=A0A844D6T4_9BURK|nr:hypothetical protein [Duganella aquatilis]MRW82919.1 hypothetical protein [Duganella aquatilis]
MACAMRTYHAGWVISTACWEENPPGWQPGDAPHYCASGKAQLVDPDAYSGTWLSKADIIAPADKNNLFTDSNLAQATIAKALREMIEALKVP